MLSDKIVVNGKVFVGTKGHLYEVSVDGKKTRVSKEYFDEQCSLEVNRTNVSADAQDKDNQIERRKGHQMSYKDKVEAYGISTEWITKKFGKYAYKPQWTRKDGKELSGEYLVIHKNKPMMIRELTFKGQMTVNELTNFSLLGLFDNWHEIVEDVKTINTFDSQKRGMKTKEDFDSMFDMALEDKVEIEVLKFTLGENELVGFYNTESGQLFGTKRYSVYEAEQKVRIQPKNLDEQFDEMFDKEIRECSNNETYRKGDEELFGESIRES